MVIYVELTQSAVTVNPSFRVGTSYVVLSIDHANQRLLLADPVTRELGYFGIGDCIYRGHYEKS